MHLHVLRHCGRQCFVVNGDGVLNGLDALSGRERFGDAGFGQRGELQRPPFVQARGRRGKVWKCGAEQFAFRTRVTGERVEEFVQVLRSARLVHKRQHQSAAGGFVNGAREPVHFDRRGFDDLLDAINFAAAEELGKHGAGTGAAAVIHAMQHAGHDPVRQQQSSFRRLDLLVIAQDALSEERPHDLPAQIRLSETGAFVDRDLEMKAAKGKLRNGGGNGRGFRFGGVLSYVQHHHDRQHPRFLVIEHLAQILGDLLTTRGHGAARLKHFPMNDELPAGAGGTGDGNFLRWGGHTRRHLDIGLLGDGFQHLHFAGGVLRRDRRGGRNSRSLRAGGR